LADLKEPAVDEAGFAAPPSTSPVPHRRRRPWVIAVAIVVAVLVYALAFERTQVSLDTITSETRQESLARILRALAHPDLITYETEDNIVATEIAVPCGAPANPAERLLLTPACAAPGETVTVGGTGFEPRQSVEIVFVPDSEFAITLRLGRAEADADGAFSTDITLPDRSSEDPQELRAVTQESIGTWRQRVEVYEDTNENGVEDDPILGDGGSTRLTLEGSPDLPAAGLVNPAGEVVQFVTTGEPFEAVGGLARGQTAIPLGEDETPETETRISGIDDGVATISGPPGADLSNWRLASYDGATGESVGTAAISDTIVMSPRISDTAKITWEKILETVFLALIATTAGLLLAVPLSFVAARNIMREISVTVTNLALLMLAVPLGTLAGIYLARGAVAVVEPIGESAPAGLVGLVATLAIATYLARAGIRVDDTEVASRADKLRRGLFVVVAGLAGLVALLLLSRLLQQAGDAAARVLGPFGFVGGFFAGIGEILEVALTVIAAIAGAGILANLASRVGYAIRSRAPRPLHRTINLVLSAVAGAVWVVLIAQAIDWFYRFDDPTLTVVGPAIVGGALGLLGAWRGMVRGEVGIGLTLYYAARTLFNGLRSTEPLVMAIVFVVWVGIGPFAGSLALALHTTAALAKLYSEQVESISTGPIEAVRATGANRLQTIVYGVVPQIVPPYISFTMYRWDINVRMSTILGFVGGGGIGSILQQNVNLLDYRAAAVQMLAIAIVVASMDYASSRLRERFV
jgi:phosphonate ABC transporter permease subunit PhnE